MWLIKSSKEKESCGGGKINDGDDNNKEVVLTTTTIDNIIRDNANSSGRVSDVSMSSIQLKEILESIPKSGRGDDSSKNVSFVLPSGGNDDSDSIFEDSNGSERKSHTELVQKVSKLTERAKNAEIALSAEKAIRKKKERSLMRLAKELKKRSLEKDSHVTMLGTAVKKTKELEEELQLVKKEKEQQNTISTKYIEDLKKTHERMLKEAQEKYVRTCAEHDARITDLTKSHATQCESLCREILKANLEADRLQNELDPTKKRTVMPFSESSRMRRMRIIGNVVIALLIIVVGLMLSWDKFELGNSICSPVMPGTTFRSTSSNIKDNKHYSSPWWAPTLVKGSVHAIVCGNGQNQIQLAWMPGYGTDNKIVIKRGEEIILNRKVVSAQVKNGGVLLENRNERMEAVYSLW